MNELEKLLVQLNEKIAKVGPNPTDGDKDNLKKMVAEAVAEQMKAQRKQQVVRKGQFVFENEDEKTFYTSIEKRIVSPARNDLDRELQSWNDDLLLTSAILKADPRSLKLYEEFQQSSVNTELRKALSTSQAGLGAEWIPTQFSSDVIDRVRLELKVGALFQGIRMPTNPYKMPVVASDATGYLQGESLANESTKLRASNTGTTNIQFTAKKLASRVVFSEEVAEDSIVPILPWLKNNVVIAIATAEEKALINGDTSGTHQDSNVTDAWDAQKAWNGLRKLSQAAAQVDIGTFNVENIRAIRAGMAKYGVDPKKLAYVTGINGYIKLQSLKDSNNNPMVTTIDKYGPNATIISGELAKLDGSPIIVSEYVYANLNASGVYDGVTTTKTIILVVYNPGFLMGDRRAVTVKTDENIETDQQLLVCTERKDFIPIYDYTTELLVGLGYNLAS